MELEVRNCEYCNDLVNPNEEGTYSDCIICGIGICDSCWMEHETEYVCEDCKDRGINGESHPR